MIYVRVELWPVGDKSRARLLGEATIANVGGSDSRGDYDVRLSKTSPCGQTAGFDTDADVAACKAPGTDCYRRGRVENYPRQSLVMWHLISRALHAALGTTPLRRRTRKVPQ